MAVKETADGIIEVNEEYLDSSGSSSEKSFDSHASNVSRKKKGKLAATQSVKAPKGKNNRDRLSVKVTRDESDGGLSARGSSAALIPKGRRVTAPNTALPGKKGVSNFLDPHGKTQPANRESSKRTGSSGHVKGYTTSSQSSEYSSSRESPNQRREHRSPDGKDSGLNRRSGEDSQHKPSR